MHQDKLETILNNTTTHSILIWYGHSLSFVLHLAKVINSNSIANLYVKHKICDVVKFWLAPRSGTDFKWMKEECK